MNKPAFTVTIPEPCQENWNEMTPREQGRFCSVCTKTVVDFSAMTDTQLFDVLKNGAGNMCGHFHKEQLDRTITAPKKPKWILQPFWKYFVGLFLFIKPAVAKAQGKPVCTPVIPDKPYVKMGIVAVDNRPKKIEKEITGIIMNSSKQALSGVVINVKGTTKYTTADSKGNFKIKAFVGEILEITDLEYQTTTYRIAQENNVTITMQKAEQVFYAGEMAVVPVTPPVEFIMDVTDKKTGKPVTHAVISWATDAGTGSKNVDKKGKASAKLSLNQQGLSFNINADGYHDNNLSYSVSEFAGQKKVTLHFQLEAVTAKPTVKGKVAATCINDKELDVTLKSKHQTTNLPVTEPGPDINVLIRGNISATPVTIKKTEEPVVSKKKQEVIPVAQKQISFYPNPIKKSGQGILNFTNEKAEACMVQVTDIQGKIIMNYRFDAAKGANLVAIPMADNITAGTYMLNLMNSKGQWVATEKVVVE